MRKNQKISKYEKHILLAFLKLPRVKDILPKYILEFDMIAGVVSTFLRNGKISKPLFYFAKEDNDYFSSVINAIENCNIKSDIYVVIQTAKIAIEIINKYYNQSTQTL
ncbi:MAG: hypothetical protein LBV58_03570 [Acholeplasmatales bacterium]|jgi:hypothetical protein|nr:hypothetical protein [Acholeplasmatales bacterium]